MLNNLLLYNSNSKLFSRDLQVTAHTFRGMKDIYITNQPTNWYKIKINISTFCRTLKDGYESDSTLVYRKHHYTPCASPSPQAKALYTQVQKGGEVPLQGLRMQAPEKKGKYMTFFLHAIWNFFYHICYMLIIWWKQKCELFMERDECNAWKFSKW